MDLGLILSGFTRALGQTGDPRFRRVLFIGVGLTIVLLAGRPGSPGSGSAGPSGMTPACPGSARCPG